MYWLRVRGYSACWCDKLAALVLQKPPIILWIPAFLWGGSGLTQDGSDCSIAPGPKALPSKNCQMSFALQKDPKVVATSSLSVIHTQNRVNNYVRRVARCYGRARPGNKLSSVSSFLVTCEMRLPRRRRHMDAIDNPLQQILDIVGLVYL